MSRFVIPLTGIFLTACLAARPQPSTPTIPPPSVLVSADNPFGAQPGDASLRRTSLVINSINLNERVDLDPTRVEVGLSGSLPNTCSQLRVEVSLPDSRYQISIEAYSVTNPSQPCDNVLRQFDARVLLGVYSAGRYTVWVNQGKVGDFVTY